MSNRLPNRKSEGRHRRHRSRARSQWKFPPEWLPEWSDGEWDILTRTDWGDICADPEHIWEVRGAGMAISARGGIGWDDDTLMECGCSLRARVHDCEAWR
jgi:hypothetical protein